MRKKTYQGRLRTKDDATGRIECVFATLEHWDLDNDYTERGAFGRQKDIVLEGWGHDRGLPVGVGEIFERGNEAVFSGRVFLDSQNGRDHFETLKGLPTVEFSYTFDILDAEPTTHNGRPGQVLKRLDVWGVGPVMRGAAGPGMTRLLQLKSADGRSAMSPRAYGRHIDALLNAHLLDELAAVEKRVKAIREKHAPSRLEAYRRQLEDEGLSPALADAWAGGAVHGLAQQLAYQHPMRAHDPNWALAEARRQLGA